MERLDHSKRLPKVLTVIWWFVYLPIAALEARLLWEQTWLTYTRGAQMIGFSLAHQFPVFVLLALACWLGCILWCIFTLVLILSRRYHISTANKIQFTLALITVIFLFLPIDNLVLRLR